MPSDRKQTKAEFPEKAAAARRKPPGQQQPGDRKMFQDLVENALSGTIILQDTRLLYANPEARRLFGPVPPDFRLTTYDGIYPADVPKVHELYRQITAGGQRTDDILLRFYPIGKIGSKPDLKCVFCRASSIAYEGRPAVLINMMDITRARELEQLLHARDKMTSLGRVAAGIAHEIRNPLSAINIHLRSVHKLSSTAEQADDIQALLGEIQSASDKIEAVIRRVMDFARPGEPKLVQSDLRVPIEEAAKLSAVTLRTSGITLTTDLKSLPRCRIDPHLIEQVILNLITNAADAIKSCAASGAIVISTLRQESHLCIHIDDSGPGVPESEQTKIFDPFYTTRSDGSGIGLSLSGRIIADHGGSLHLGRSPLGGARFTIELPLTNGADA